MTATEKCTACGRRHSLCTCNDEPESADAAELARLRGIEAAAKAWPKDCAEYSCYEERCNSKVAALLSDILAGRGPT